MFEKASRLQLRYPYSKGSITTEDLWELPVEELDIIFKNLNSKLKATQEDSLLKVKTVSDEKLNLQVKIVRHVAETLMAEAEARVNAKKRSEERQKLLAILATKKAAALENLSEEEIEARIAALG